MVRRTCCRTETFHLLNHERNECAGIQKGFRLLVEIRLVCRAAAFYHTQELVLLALGCFDVNLSGKIATCIHFLVHGKRSILAIAQVLLGIGFVNAFREGFFITEASPHLLSLFAVDYGRASVLTEGQLSL